MNRHSFSIGTIILASLALLSGCNSDSSKGSFLWQQPYYAKLKVEVDTPEGVKSGYSVIEVKWDKANKSFKVRGEAVAVDLPGGETFFVLLRSKSSVDWPAYLHYNVKLEGKIDTHEELYARIAEDRSVWPVERIKKSPFGRDETYDNYPYFVRFNDIADPKSVEQVDPDDLAATYGKGYALKSLTVQMTDEPVTKGIEKRLAWLESLNGALVKQPRLQPIADRPLSGALTEGDFYRGIRK